MYVCHMRGKSNLPLAQAAIALRVSSPGVTCVGYLDDWAPHDDDDDDDDDLEFPLTQVEVNKGGIFF